MGRAVKASPGRRLTCFDRRVSMLRTWIAPTAPTTPKRESLHSLAESLRPRHWPAHSVCRRVPFSPSPPGRPARFALSSARTISCRSAKSAARLRAPWPVHDFRVELQPLQDRPKSIWSNSLTAGCRRFSRTTESAASLPTLVSRWRPSVKTIPLSTASSSASARL